MTDQTDQDKYNAGDDDTSVRPQQPDPGAILTSAREARGVSVAEIAREMGLTESAVRDLEANQYGKFPAGIYVWGYLRNYCKRLNMDEAAVLDGYSRISGEQKGVRDSERFAPKPAPGAGTGGLVLFILVILGLVGLAGFLIYRFFIA